MTESSMNKPTDESGNSQPPSLKKRVIRGSVWTLGGHIISQVIRLGSNLIVSRLLFPEAFGLMALVYTFLSGLEMLSDLGIGPSVIQSKRGDDPKFLNTAWVLSIGRGFVLWIASCIIAYPVSRFYNEPILLYMLPVAGLGTLALSFQSTKLTTTNRALELSRLTIIDLVGQVAGVSAMVVAAWFAYVTKAPQDIAVWALLVGTLIGAVVRVLMSHFFLKGVNNRFEWDHSAFQEVQRFGRWIFVSTLLTFFALQGNNLIIPRLLGVGFLGIFSFATNLANTASSILGIVGSRVLYPSYAELARDRPERLYPVLKRTRLVLNGMNWGICLIFIFFGKALIQLMYDARYADAGWMLQILALGSLVTMIGSTYTNVLLAQGQTFMMSALMGAQVFVQFACMFIGYYLGGEQGVVIGIAAMGWALYPFQAICFAKLKIWQPEVDLPAIALASGMAVLVLFRLV
uniref:Teichoic acid transporter n=1 Tax=Oscillatoriales cyanobacterium SpSt-402 TaxID=2282168 RepID=A0A832M4E0_9CYAN